MYAVAAAVAAAVLTSCSSATTLGYGDAGTEPGTGSDGEEIHPADVSAAYLRSLAVGRSTLINETLSVRGRVTATDAYGEYYKTICIEDSTGGIEVLIDCFRLYTFYALYDEVRIECHGLALGRYGSRIQLGAPPTDEYAVDYIPQSDMGRYISVSKEVDDTFTPVTTAIAGLRPEYVGRTVKIEGLHFSDTDASWCDTDPADGRFVDTERTAADDSGMTLTVTVRGECRYAAEPLPSGSVTLCGIVEYRNDAYALRITNHGIIPEFSYEL